MACKLLIIKLTRNSTSSPFFTSPDYLKEDLRKYGPPAIVGERNLSDGLVKIRMLLFPTISDYDNWLINPVILANNQARADHNQLHGITESRRVIDLEDLDILSKSII